jgi:hypothetical protein
MATYLELYSLVENEDFNRRIAVGLWKTAGDVFDEATSVPNHDLRQNLAMKLVTGGMQTPKRIMAIAVLQVPTIFAAGASATDAQLQAAVDNLFTTLARMEARYGA